MKRPTDGTQAGRVGRGDVDVDASLRAVADLEWPGPDRNRRIEEALMEHSVKQTGWNKKLGMWIAAGAVLASGAVYGSVRLYDRYFVKMTVNGKESVHEVEALPDGTALLEVPMEGGGKAKILVGPENAGEDGRIHASVTIDSSATGGTSETVTIEAVPPAGGEKPAAEKPAPDKPAETKPATEPAPKK